jgi:carbon storage regulator CsrA
MLVVTRKNLESVVVGASDDVDGLLKVTVLEILGSSVKLGFDVNREVPINRWEVWRRIRAGSQHPGQRTRRMPPERV